LQCSYNQYIMSHISSFPLPARLFRKSINFAFKRFFSEYIVVGRENIPVNTPIIFAPNHINALMDALAVHSIAPPKLPVIFLARSDTFQNKTIAKFLHQLDMLPAFRMRDGIKNLGKNNEIFQLCVEVLHHNKAIGIMPEGNQGEERRLRPFSKGIFRIAFAAQQKYGTQPAVKIMPIGIDFGDFVKYGKHVIINIGKPIEISDYFISYVENPAAATNQIRDHLSSDLSKLTVNLDTETHYHCFETALDVVNTEILKIFQLPFNTVARFEARQKTANMLLSIEKNDLKKINHLDLLCTEYTSCVQKLNLKTWTLEQAPYNSTRLIFDALLLFTTSAFFILGFIFNVLPFLLPIVIRKALKVEYSGFFMSIHFVFGLFTFPVFYVVQSVIICSVLNAPWWTGLLLLTGQYAFGKYALRWYREAKRLMAKVRYHHHERNNSDTLKHVQLLRKKIIQLIIN